MRDIIIFTYGGSFPAKISQIKCYVYVCKCNFVTGSGVYKVHRGNSTKTSFYDYILPFSVWTCNNNTAGFCITIEPRHHIKLTGLLLVGAATQWWSGTTGAWVFFFSSLLIFKVTILKMMLRVLFQI